MDNDEAALIFLICEALQLAQCRRLGVTEPLVEPVPEPDGAPARLEVRFHPTELYGLRAGFYTRLLTPCDDGGAPDLNETKRYMSLAKLTSRPVDEQAVVARPLTVILNRLKALELEVPRG